MDTLEFLLKAVNLGLGGLGFFAIIQLIAWQRTRDYEKEQTEQMESQERQRFLDVLSAQADRFAALADGIKTITAVLQASEQRNQERFEKTMQALSADQAQREDRFRAVHDRMDALSRDAVATLGAKVDGALEVVRGELAEAVKGIRADLSNIETRVAALPARKDLEPIRSEIEVICSRVDNAIAVLQAYHELATDRRAPEKSIEAQEAKEEKSKDGRSAEPGTGQPD